MPYINKAHRVISMQLLREDWLMQHKKAIDALAPLPGHVAGKWGYWIKAFLFCGIDAGAKRTKTGRIEIRAELGDYIRRHAGELLSGARYEATIPRNRIPPEARGMDRDQNEHAWLDS